MCGVGVTKDMRRYESVESDFGRRPLDASLNAIHENVKSDPFSRARIFAVVFRGEHPEPLPEKGGAGVFVFQREGQVDADIRRFEPIRVPDRPRSIYLMPQLSDAGA